jgi:hypothetical protein
MNDASACKDEISFYMKKEFRKLKHILSIELSSSVYLCFSCMDARHTLSSNKYFVGPLINKELTSEHKTLLENFVDEQCNDDSSDSEISESLDDESKDSSEITSSDAIQVLKDMGIYDKFRTSTNLLSAVQRYVNIKFRELDVPEEDIPKYTLSKSGNIHQSHYDYYKRIAEILDEFDADGHDEFVNDKSNAGGTRDISSFLETLSDKEVEYYREQTLSEIQLDEDLEDLDDDYTSENLSKRFIVFGKVYVVFVVEHTSGKLIGYIFDDDIHSRAKEPIAKYYNKNIEPFSPRATEEQKIIVDEIIRMLEGF